jgi:hypothetical protein
MDTTEPESSSLYETVNIHKHKIRGGGGGRMKRTDTMNEEYGYG